MDKYENEVRERYGNTDAYREHKSKTKNYTKERWADANEGLMKVFAEFATLKDSGKQLKIRATAVVWAAGPNGVEEYNALGRNDDVYSWRPTQVVSGN